MPPTCVLRRGHAERTETKRSLLTGTGSGGSFGMRLTPWHPSCRLINVLVIVHHNIPAPRHHESTRDTVGLDQIGRNVGGAARNGTIASQQSHFGSRNGNEIVHSRFVGHFHDIIGSIVHDFDKRQHFHIANARTVLQDVSSMIAIVQIVVGMTDSEFRSLHSGRITADNWKRDYDNGEKPN
jgi:hypothetical protein